MRVKKGIGILLLAGVLLTSGGTVYASADRIFADVPEDHWAKTVILEGYRDGVLGGTSLDPQTGVRSFSPEAKITMAQFSALLAKAFYPQELEAVEQQEAWYGSARTVCERHGLYQNTAGTLSEEMTRYDMAVMMRNYLIDRKVSLPGKDRQQACVKRISDYSGMPDSYRLPVLQIYALGLLKGVDESGAFSGDTFLTRAQAVAVYSRLKNLQKTEAETPQEEGESDAGAGSVSGEPSGPADSGESPESPAEPFEPDTAFIQNRLLSLKEEYPDGMPWGRNNRYDSPSVRAMGWSGSGGCTALAFLLQDRIFGEDLIRHPIRVHRDFFNVKPGDILHLVVPESHYEHDILVTHVGASDRCQAGLLPEGFSSDDPYTVTGCSGNTGGRVTWADFGLLNRFGPECKVITRQ